MIARRRFIGGLSATAVWPVAARAQQSAVGWLSSRSAEIDSLVMPAFRRALNAQGFVEGRNITIEYRYAQSQLDRLPELAEDIVRRGANIVVVLGDGAAAVRAVRATSAVIPILCFISDEMVKNGVIDSINRPGGNITGVANYQSAVLAKRLGLLHDLLPLVNKIAVLINPQQEGGVGQKADVEDAARSLGLQTHLINTTTETELDAALAAFVQERPEAVFVTSGPLFFTRMNQIVAATTRLALPSSFFRREFVDAGGLMSYASSPQDSYRVLGEYAGRILKGERVGDLPVQQPSKFELVLNLKTVKALGLRVPTSMVLLADEVIE